MGIVINRPLGEQPLADLLAAQIELRIPSSRTAGRGRRDGNAARCP
jgi:hypothetical protein